MKDVKIPGVWGALIPVIITIISVDGVQAVLDNFTQQTVDAASGAGLDPILVTAIAGVLGVLVSAVMAYIKAASVTTPPAASNSNGAAPRSRTLGPAGSEPVSPKRAFLNGA